MRSSTFTRKGLLRSDRIAASAAAAEGLVAVPVRRRRVRPSLAGFSLIEVTMAIGIASFCMLTLMGLLPVGLTMLRDAVDQTEESQIIQCVQGEILQTPFSQLQTRYASRTLYFSDAGTEVAEAAGARYKVATSLLEPVYPGSGAAPAGSIGTCIQTVRVDVTRIPSAPGAVPGRYHIPISKSGD